MGATMLKGLASGLIAVLSGLLGGCVVPIPAKATTARSAELPSSDRIALVVLFSPDFSPETVPRLGRDMVRCITRAVARTVPDVRLVSEAEFHQAVFAANPGEVLLRQDTISELFTRPMIAERVGDFGVTHLVLVAGGTTRHGQAVPVAGRGGAAIVSEMTKTTRLTASILELRRGAEVTRVEASAEGSQFIAGGILCCVPFLFGWVPMTESPSCGALGAEVARTLRHHKP
jgi:hypothetical protein